MASNPVTSDDVSAQHHSIVYCPSCGASVSLPGVPPSNAGLFCDICTSPDLLVSTNDGADWNPLSDAFNALSLSSEQHAPPTLLETPQEPTHSPAELEVPTPTMQDEMKRRSLILSELMNFREALYTHQDSNHEDQTDPDTMAEDPIARTFNDLLNLRQQSGMFLMDEVDTMNHNPYTYQNGYPEEEPGMYDDPPQDYVNAHPPVQEADQGWYNPLQSHQVLPETQYSPQNHEAEDDDDEGQVYATPEQREEMRKRREELHKDKELRDRELFWRNYGIGGLGVGR